VDSLDRELRGLTSRRDAEVAMLAHPGLALLCTFGAVVLGVYALALMADPYWRTVRQRTRALAGDDDAEDDRQSTPTLLGRFVELAVDKDGDRDFVVAQLAKAGINRPAAAGWYFSAKLALAILALAASMAAYLAGWVRWDSAAVGGLAAAILGSVTPNVWLQAAVRRRQRNLRRALPDLLDLIIVCLEGGMSLPESLRRVTDELRIAHPDLAADLLIVQRDIELGSTVDQALRRFAVRADFEGLRTLSTFVRESQRFGTRLTEALRSHADLLRSQREQSAEERAQKASVKILLPTLLLILPAVFVVLVGPAVIQIQQAFGGK
jgi:tight adherence protein C